MHIQGRLQAAQLRLNLAESGFELTEWREFAM